MGKVLTHKFQDGGMGKAPYRLYGVWSMPSKAILEQNPAAYNIAMRSKPSCCKGSCDHCGTGITHHFMIVDANDDLYVVGSSCVGHLGDTKLEDEVKVQARKIRNDIAKERRDQKRAEERAAREAELEAQKERNGGLTDYELGIKERQDKEAADREHRKEVAKPILDVLGKVGGYFCDDMDYAIIRGNNLSPNQQRVIIEIAAKQFGRKNSKAYKEAYPDIEEQYRLIFKQLEDFNRSQHG